MAATDDSLPRLRLVSLAELDDLAKLNEPVEPLARDQAMEIINDIKVRRRGWVVALHVDLRTTGKCARLDQPHGGRSSTARAKSCDVRAASLSCTGSCGRNGASITRNHKDAGL